MRRGRFGEATVISNRPPAGGRSRRRVTLGAGARSSDDETRHHDAPATRRLRGCARRRDRERGGSDRLRGGGKWCLGTDLNRRHADFQSAALPTELPRRPGREARAAARVPEGGRFIIGEIGAVQRGFAVGRGNSTRGVSRAGCWWNRPVPVVSPESSPSWRRAEAAIGWFRRIARDASRPLPVGDPAPRRRRGAPASARRDSRFVVTLPGRAAGIAPVGSAEGAGHRRTATVRPTWEGRGTGPRRDRSSSAAALRLRRSPRRRPLRPPERHRRRSASGGGRRRGSGASRRGVMRPSPACRRSGRASPERLRRRSSAASGVLGSPCQTTGTSGDVQPARTG